MNITLLGNVAGEVEVKETQSGTLYARFRVAEYKGKADGKNEYNYWSCVAYGKSAETMQKYFPKGKAIVIGGRCDNNNYEKDGQKVYSVAVTVDKIGFPPKDFVKKEEPPKVEAKPTMLDGFEPAIDDDLPF